jgi:hypothetical protein
MARPKLGKTETERLQLKITAAEIEAIDDWRFGNRVASRSEAIRRLCQIGITADDVLSDAVDHAEMAKDLAHKHWAHLREKTMSLKDAPEHVEVFETYHQLLTPAHELSEIIDRTHLLIVSIYNRIAPIVDSKTFRQGLAKSELVRRNFAAEFERIRRHDREIQENMVIVKVSMSETPEERAVYDALSEDEKDTWWEQKMLEELGPAEDEGED